MKCINQVLLELKRISNKISQSVKIPLEDKKDIISSTIEKVLILIQQKKLVDDFETIKGYVFIIYRNKCISYHKLNNSMLELKENIIIDNSYLDFENKETYFKQVEEIKISLVRDFYTEREQILCLLLLDDVKPKEIHKIMELDRYGFNNIQTSLIKKLKYYLNSNVKSKYKPRKKNIRKYKSYE